MSESTPSAVELAGPIPPHQPATVLAKTAAQRQADRRERITQTIDQLVETTRLQAEELRTLRAELDQARTKIHEMQLRELRSKARKKA